MVSGKIAIVEWGRKFLYTPVLSTHRQILGRLETQVKAHRELSQAWKSRTQKVLSNQEWKGLGKWGGSRRITDLIEGTHLVQCQVV